MLRSRLRGRRDGVASMAPPASYRGEPATSERPGTAEPERLGLLASAIAGRPIDVAATEPGGPGWTDGFTIFVDAASSPVDQRTSTAVQAALLGAGSLDPDIVAALARRPVLTRRYLAVEGHRALDAHDQLLPAGVRGLIDRDVASRSEDPRHSLALATGRDHRDDPPPLFGTIHPKRLRGSEAGGRHDGLAGEHLARDAHQTPVSEVDDDETDGADLFSSPVGGGGAIGRWLQKLFSEGRSTDTGPPGAESVSRWSARNHNIARTTAFSASAAPIRDGSTTDDRQGSTYPEWDAGKRRYKAGWCTVVEVDPIDLVAFDPPPTGPLRRPLARLGIELERCHRQLQGDDLDIDAAVDACVQLKAESAPDESVYIDTVRRRRDLSVLLLLDISGSAGEASVTGEPVHRHQRAAAAALAGALYEMGDRVALYGFRSQGRFAVQVAPIKRFGEDLDQLVMLRLGGLVPGAYTRLGAAIRHGTAVLDDEGGTSRRLLVVLSDGFAYDHGYERDYGEADARRALVEARRLGIGTLCLSVGAGTDADALGRVFGVAAHAAVPRVEDLSPLVGPLFRSALGSADLRRRVAQRRIRTKERLEIERKAG